MNGHRASRLTALGIVVALGCTNDMLTVPAPPPPPPPGPVLGTIGVSVSLSGRDLDTDGFTVQLDDGPQLALTAQSPVFYSDVAQGQHTVRLAGVALNCEVDGPMAYGVDVSPGAGLHPTVRFEVVCMTHGTGRLRVFVHRGFSPFGVSVAEGPVVTAAGTLLVSELLPGTHDVRLVLDTGACTLDGPNPRPATVTAGRTTFVGFFVYCDLVVSVNTTGENRPAGYTAYIEQPDDFYCYEACYGLSVNATGTVAFIVFPATEYRISLRGVPQNCTAAPASHSVTIPAGGKGTAAFAVSCR